MTVMTAVTAPTAALSAPAESPPAPVLTVIRLDPRSREARADRHDLCRMHGRVVEMLGLQPGEVKGRELWASPSPERLLVQYERPVDVRWLPDGYHVGHDVHEVRADWPAGARVRWAVIANPVHSRSHSGRRGVIEPVDPQVWARRRLDALDLEDVVMHERHHATGRHRGGPVTHDRVRLTGVGTVLDPARLAGQIRSGVGRGRAFGCGLLLVAPA